MTTGTAGDIARLFAWQMSHYLVRGGPNDPVLPTTPTPPAQPTGGGILSWNSVLTLPPVPGAQPPINRTQSLNSTGTLAAGVLGTNNGGILVGTIPQGAWIEDIELMCYASLAGGTSTSIGIFYAPANTLGPAPGFQPASLNLLAYITSPAAGTLYATKGAGDANMVAFTAVTAAPGPLGPGTAVTGVNQLASLSDIDIYVAGFLIAGSGTANTGGCYSLMMEFTGLEG